ncbi:MAG: hypothetical protein AAFZ17_17250 [Cyanobacteria bacterium J06650_10]
MIILTPEEINHFKTRLIEYPEALKAIQEIEDCDGDLEDAAISLALRAGQEPDTNEQWLASFSKRYRHIACQSQFRQALTEAQPEKLVQYLANKTDCPALLATPVAIYVTQFDVDAFCHSFDTSRI